MRNSSSDKDINSRLKDNSSSIDDQRFLGRASRKSIKDFIHFSENANQMKYL